MSDNRKAFPDWKTFRQRLRDDFTVSKVVKFFLELILIAGAVEILSRSGLPSSREDPENKKKAIEAGKAKAEDAKAETTTLGQEESIL